MDILELPAKEMAAACGLNYRKFSAMNVLPCRHEKREGRTYHIYRLSEVLEAYHQHQSQQSMLASPAGEVLDKEYEETLKIREDRISRQLKNQKALREQAPISALETALSSAVGSVAAVLTSLPLNIKRRNPEVSTVIIREVEREITFAMNQMADIQIEWEDED